MVSPKQPVRACAGVERETPPVSPLTVVLCETTAARQTSMQPEKLPPARRKDSIALLHTNQPDEDSNSASQHVNESETNDESRIRRTPTSRAYSPVSRADIAEPFQRADEHDNRPESPIQAFGQKLDGGAEKLPRLKTLDLPPLVRAAPQAIARHHQDRSEETRQADPAVRSTSESASLVEMSTFRGAGSWPAGHRDVHDAHAHGERYKRPYQAPGDDRGRIERPAALDTGSPTLPSSRIAFDGPRSLRADEQAAEIRRSTTLAPANEADTTRDYTTAHLHRIPEAYHSSLESSGRRSSPRASRPVSGDPTDAAERQLSTSRDTQSHDVSTIAKLDHHRLPGHMGYMDREPAEGSTTIAAGSMTGGNTPYRLVEKRKTDILPPPGSSIAAYSSMLTPFIYKLYCLVSEDSTKELCHWTASGDSFVVPDPTAFAATVLPQYFKHNQFASFVRQLNKYRFHKLTPGTCVFGHEKFKRDRPDLLPEIIRQRSPDRSAPPVPVAHGFGAMGAGRKPGRSVMPGDGQVGQQVERGYDGMHPAVYGNVNSPLQRSMRDTPLRRSRNYDDYAGGASDDQHGLKRHKGMVVREDAAMDTRYRADSRFLEARAGSTRIDEYVYYQPYNSKSEAHLSNRPLDSQVDQLLREREGMLVRIATLEDHVERLSRRVESLEQHLRK